MNVQSIRHIANGAARTIPIVFSAALLMGGGIVSVAGQSKAEGFNPSILTTQPPKGKQTTLGL